VPLTARVRSAACTGDDAHASGITHFSVPDAVVTCSDGTRNGDETGVDCGGSCTSCTPPSCSDGVQNGDEYGVDCSGSCTACVRVPTCSDRFQNGDETGVDCGGLCTTAC
jgi:hypothetical protein